MNEYTGTAQNPNLENEIAPHSTQNSYWWQETTHQKQIAEELQKDNDSK